MTDVLRLSWGLDRDAEDLDREFGLDRLDHAVDGGRVIGEILSAEHGQAGQGVAELGTPLESVGHDALPRLFVVEPNQGFDGRVEKRLDLGCIVRSFALLQEHILEIADPRDQGLDRSRVVDLAESGQGFAEQRKLAAGDRGSDQKIDFLVDVVLLARRDGSHEVDQISLDVPGLWDIAGKRIVEKS